MKWSGAHDRAMTDPNVRTRPFGWTGEQVPVIGQGTWQVHDPDRAEGALRLGLELGMTHIDTAELYTGSEEVVGRAIEGRRDEVFLVSKVLPRNASYDGTLEACQRSLKKLGTDQLDVYLLHWRGGQHPLEDTFRAMGDLVDDGKVRYVGVSNFDVPDLEDARDILGPRRIACNQVLYHLKDRGAESEVIPWCDHNGIAVVGYSPFGSGDFPTRGSSGRKVLADVASQIGKTARQVALAFLTRGGNTFTIPKAENPDHVRENAGGGFVLGADHSERIDEAFPVEPGLRLL